MDSGDLGSRLPKAPTPVTNGPRPANQMHKSISKLTRDKNDHKDSNSTSSADTENLVNTKLNEHDLDLEPDKAQPKPKPQRRLAHNLEDPNKTRSADVGVGAYDLSGKDFASLKVTQKVLEGLNSCGFFKPSPIQLSAVPLGRLGRDMIIQAKSGTGKTVVFAISALEKVNVNVPNIQVLVVSPTREIAFQSTRVIREIGAKIDGLKIATFIGGIQIDKDINRLKDCQIVVGTPGRLVHLLRDYEMDLTAVKIYVQDEADRLLERSFFDDLQYIYEKLPKTNCQVIVSSATYPKGIDDLIAKTLKDPIRVQLDRDAPILEAVEQYVVDVKEIYPFKLREGQRVIRDDDIYQLKKRAVKDLIMLPYFKQVIIFMNVQARAERFYIELLDEGINLVYLASSMLQKERIKVFTQFRQGKCRIMVATDIASRGLDFENVDIVINYELPMDLETYIHRMGRTGRFGTFGTNIVLLGSEYEKRAFEDFQSKMPTLKIYKVEDNDTFMKIGAMEAEKKTQKLLIKKQRAEKAKAKLLLSEKHLPSLGEILDGMLSGKLPLDQCNLDTYSRRFEKHLCENRKQVREQRKHRAEIEKPVDEHAET